MARRLTALLLLFAAEAAGLHLRAPVRSPALAPARSLSPRLCLPPPDASLPPAAAIPSVPPSAPLAEQFGLFWRLAVPYFQQAEGAKTGIALLLALTLANSGVSVLFSYTSRDFWTALSSKDADQFYALTLRFAGALAAATPVSVLYKYQRARLSVSWREWMTLRLTEMYTENEAYYRLEIGGGTALPPLPVDGADAAGEGGDTGEVARDTRGVDNPDQRIAEDARAFTRVSLDFGITLLTSAIDLFSFSTILWCAAWTFRTNTRAANFQSQLKENRHVAGRWHHAVYNTSPRFLNSYGG